jgi:hypothetical protein
MLRMPHVADKDGWGYGPPFNHSDSNNNDAANTCYTKIPKAGTSYTLNKPNGSSDGS